MFVEPELHDLVEKLVESVFSDENLPFLPSARQAVDLVPLPVGQHRSDYAAKFCTDLVLRNVLGREFDAKHDQISAYKSTRKSLWKSKRNVFEPVLKEFQAFDPKVLVELINASDAMKSMPVFEELKEDKAQHYIFMTRYFTAGDPVYEVRLMIYGRASASSVAKVGITVAKDGDDVADFSCEALMDTPSWLLNKKNHPSTEGEVKAVADEIAYLIGLITEIFPPAD